MSQDGIPDRWIEASGNELFSFVTSGSRGWAEHYADSGALFLRIGNLDRGTVFLDMREIQRVLPPQGTEGTRTEVRTGDILISITADLGMVAVVPPALEKAFINQHIALARPWIQDSSKYIAWFVASPPGQHQLLSLQRGATKKGLGLDDVRSLRVPLAPQAEQHRIVAELEKQLTRLDAGVEALKRLQAHLKRYRASVLKAACEGKLVPTEAELARKEGRDYEPADKLLERILKERRARWEAEQIERMRAAGGLPKDDKWKARYKEPEVPDLSRAGALPEGWCWTSVDAVGDVLLGRQRAPQYLTGLHSRPYLRVANIKDDKLDLTDVEEMDFDDDHYARYKLQPGDILLSEGQSLELVGQSAIYRGELGGLCFQKTLHRFRPFPPGPGPEFAQVVFRAHVKSQVFRPFASITTNIAHLTLEKLKTVPFPLPPEAEQNRITAKTAALMSSIDQIQSNVNSQLARAARLRQSILKLAFEGKLVPQDPNDEPAAVLLERIKAAREADARPAEARPARRGRPRKLSAG